MTFLEWWLFSGAAGAVLLEALILYINHTELHVEIKWTDIRDLFILSILCTALGFGGLVLSLTTYVIKILQLNKRHSKKKTL